MRPPLRVWIPTNRKYTSNRNRGRPKGMDGLNEIISQNRANKNFGARIEQENLLHCAWHIRKAMRKAGYARMDEADRCRCNVYVNIIEPNDQRDVANVFGGVLKYALDALTARNKNGAGAIWDDNTQWMPRLVPSIRVDPDNPGIEITVIPLDLEGSHEA